MMRFDAGKALTLYAGAITVALCAMMLTGAATPSPHFDTIDVHRINLTEDDGTPRLILASRDHFPGAIYHGQDHPHPGCADSAGMIFLDDEGSENGGLIFGGKRADGKVTSFGHLSFDQHEQDQVLTMEQTEEGGERRSGVTIADRPDAPIDIARLTAIERLPAAEREALVEKLRATGEFGAQRGFFGKTEAHDAMLALRDGQGRVRLQLRVTADGAASIEFLDAAGRVTRIERPYVGGR